MRSRKDVEAEIDALGMPPADWRCFNAVRESMGLAKKWREANPEQSRRHSELTAELEAIERNEREVEALARAMSKAQSGGVGERTREAASAPKETPALLASRQWLDSGRAWLLLAGDVGTGKSVAAVWVLLEVAKAGQSVAFRRAAEVARLSGFDAGAEELARLKRVGLLVLDDLGTECATGWGASILHELLDTRHEAKLRTIITSNLKRADARARLGDRLSDRVQQDGRVVWLEGKSLRGAA